MLPAHRARWFDISSDISYGNPAKKDVEAERRLWLAIRAAGPPLDGLRRCSVDPLDGENLGAEYARAYFHLQESITSSGAPAKVSARHPHCSRHVNRVGSCQVSVLNCGSENVDCNHYATQTGVDATRSRGLHCPSQTIRRLLGEVDRFGFARVCEGGYGPPFRASNLKAIR